MSILLDDKELESKIDLLAKGQDIPCSKRAMVIAILVDVAKAYDESGDPRCWIKTHQPA